MLKELALCAPCALFVCACEKFNFDVDVVSSSGYVVPLGHGLGTQDRPLTPDEMLEGVSPQTMAECWVMGYAVGSSYSTMSNALFEVPTSYQNNILLASDSLCVDAKQCVPVELSTTSMKSSFSLYYRPEMFRQFVVVCGTYGQYYGQSGLRSVTQGYWIPQFDMGAIVVSPEEWEEFDSEY